MTSNFPNPNTNPNRGASLYPPPIHNLFYSEPQDLSHDAPSGLEHQHHKQFSNFPQQSFATNPHQVLLHPQQQQLLMQSQQQYSLAQQQQHEQQEQNFQPQPIHHQTFPQQASQRKRTLNVRSKNFQNFSTPPRYGSQMNADPNSTYDSSTDITLSSVATEPNPSASSMHITALNTYPIEHLNLGSFKLNLCSHTTQHNHKQCPFYHNLKDRKRPGNFYSADLCEFAENPENCPNGDMCLKAHNRVEQLYKPEKYKTKFCGHYPLNLHLCEYGTFCSFAHSESDITIDLIHNFEYDDDFYMFHFKTIWCPFNLTQHDKALCVYAHNWQDYRRKPHLFSYDPLPCPNWKSTDFIATYEEGCPLKDKCTKCHGWKELEYHPMNYKTKHCPSKNCIKGKDCPHYHHMKERRAIMTTIANRIFKLVPRNRIVTGTFKKRKDEPIESGMNLSANLGGMVNELPPQEQLKWMNSMIQNMMAAHSMQEIKKTEFDEKAEGNLKRRSSVDFPYFEPTNQESEQDVLDKSHPTNLFGLAERSSKKLQHLSRKGNTPGDPLYGPILESPMQKFTSHSMHNLDELHQHIDSPKNSVDDDLDHQMRQHLEKMIDNDNDNAA